MKKGPICNKYELHKRANINVSHSYNELRIISRYTLENVACVS